MKSDSATLERWRTKSRNGSARSRPRTDRRLVFRVALIVAPFFWTTYHPYAQLGMGSGTPERLSRSPSAMGRTCEQARAFLEALGLGLVPGTDRG